MLTKTRPRQNRSKERGPAATAIVDYAREEDIELIVMASHGYSGMERWTHGCVAERVLHAASAPVLLVRAQEMDSDDLQHVADQLEGQGIKASTVVRTGPVVETIVQFAETNHVDLIAMCTHGRTGMARWALGSVADRILRAGSIPILLVRAR